MLAVMIFNSLYFCLFIMKTAYVSGGRRCTAAVFIIEPEYTVMHSVDSG